MSARIIDGKALAAEIRTEVADRVRRLGDRGVTPGLAAVLVGDDPASKIYVASKQKAAAEAGVTAIVQPGGSVRDDEVIAAADEHGIPMVFTGRRHFRH